MFAAVFSAFTTTPRTPCEHAKRHHSEYPTEGEDVRSKKKERTYLEAERRASLINVETCQLRARELASRASSSILEAIERSSTEGEKIYRGTTEGDTTIEVVVLRKLSRPSCLSSLLCASTCST